MPSASLAAIEAAAERIKGASPGALLSLPLTSPDGRARRVRKLPRHPALAAWLTSVEAGDHEFEGREFARLKPCRTSCASTRKSPLSHARRPHCQLASSPWP